MAENFYTMLTIVGKNKLSSSAVSGSKVNFKTLKVGDGKGAYYEPSENQTSLVNEVWEGNISSISIDENNSNWIVVETVIPASDGGFFIREAGVFDEDGDMIAISKLAETYKPVVAEGSTKDLVIRIVLEVLNVDTVTIKIDPNVVAATKNDVQVLEAKVQDVSAQLSEKANDTDSNRTTTDKTVTGAINELNSGKMARTINATNQTLNRDFTDLGRYHVGGATAGFPTGYSTDNDLVLDSVPWAQGGTTYRREMLYDIRHAYNIFTRQVWSGSYNPWYRILMDKDFEATILALPYDSGYADGDVNWHSRLLKIGKMVIAYINVRKTDNTQFVAGTEIKIATLPIGWTASSIKAALWNGAASIYGGNALYVVSTVNTNWLQGSFIYYVE